MYSPVKQGLRFIQYYLRASNGKGHGMHSPFVFNFITRVLNDDRQFYCYQPIEECRRQLLSDDREILMEDFGAKSVSKPYSTRRVKEFARASLKPPKFGQLLFRIADYYAPRTILELGTSFGITTAYLASASKESTVITMEGALQVAAVATENFGKLQLVNISQVPGNFDHTLPVTLSKLKQVDLAFIDGNHRYEPTIRYFEELIALAHEHSILIFDDIHWSAEMEKAWSQIRKDERVTLSIDLFFIGLVFFRKENRVKQHFTIRF